MEQAKIKIPTTKEELKIFNRNICQLEKGCLAKLEKDYRNWINSEFFLRWEGGKGTHHKGIKKISCKFPICCEFCKYCGTIHWHCHNPKSFKHHININPNDLCSKWQPNIGLMLLLWDRIMSKRETSVGFSLEELKKKGALKHV